MLDGLGFRVGTLQEGIVGLQVGSLASRGILEQLQLADRSDSFTCSSFISIFGGSSPKDFARRARRAKVLSKHPLTASPNV